ncbi:Sec1-like protein [Baffinella frigidus]|nr:Sec1-like protein [Cryptophyta sp. CCMP2293]
MIRFKLAVAGSIDVAERIAKDVELNLDRLEQQAARSQPPQNLWWNEHGEGGTLLVLDRASDVTSPLMHEYTYQAMAHDLLDIKDERYKYKYTNAKGDQLVKEVLLNELDPIFPALRHLHIAEAIDSVLNLFNTFLQNNKVRDRWRIEGLVAPRTPP